MNTRRDQYIADVTSGLKGDPELRRDVSAEIGSHIDAATETSIAEGHTGEESLETTLKSFGSPVTLAGDLVDANRKRMRLRAWFRILVGAAVVPAAVILTVWMVATAVERTVVLTNVFNMSSGTGVSVAPRFLTYEEAETKVVARWNLSPRDHLIVFGDRSKSRRAEQQKAICSLDPTNRVFYANYILYRLTDSYAKGVELDGLLHDLQIGEQLDPGNAYYNYIAAGTMVQNAGELVWVGQGTNKTMSYVIKDTNLLERAMVEFQRGIDKPFHRTYISDLVAMRRSLLPPSENVSDEVVKIAMAAGVLLPQVALNRNLARVSKEYGTALIQEGRPDEAANVLGRILPFAEDLTQDSWSLIEVFVAAAITGIARDGVPPLLEKAGHPKEAAIVRLKANAMAAPVADWRNKLKGQDFSKWRARASVLAGMLLPALGDQGITEAELAPGRRVEQIILEQSALMVVILGFLVLMVVAALLALRWRRAKGADAAPFLVLPDWRQGLLIIGISVVMPLALYIVYTRFTGLAGRDFALVANPWRFILELAGLGIFILVCSVWLTLRHVRRRCRALGVPVPATRWKGITAWFAVWRSDYGLYLGTSARSLIPAYAVAILLLGGVVQPWLAHEETRWLRADPLISQDNNNGLTSVETRLITRLKKEMLEGARRGEP